MEEKIQHYDCFFDKKQSKLKPFDLEAAKIGKPVCTRDGHKARIICFDAKGVTYPILALIEECGKESTYCYDTCGKSTVHPNNDLMMLPEKHEGWVNVYKNKSGERSIGCMYPTKEKAISKVKMGDDYVTTVKIEWEE